MKKSEQIVWDKVVRVDIDAIKPHPKNPHKITDKDIQTVAASIRQFGFIQPILVGKDNVIRVGHTRWQAAKQLGYTQVPVVVLDLPNIDSLLAIDNLTHSKEWELDLMADLIKSEPEINWTEYMTDRELAAFLRQGEPEEEDSDVGGIDVPPSYSLVVNCSSEAEQTLLFEDLKRRGYDVQLSGDGN